MSSKGRLREALNIALMLVIIVVIVGVAYPVVMFAYSRIFSAKADGNLIYVNGKAVGSRLIGQKFTSDYFFHGRPSSAGKGYDAMASGASNLGPTNPKLAADMRARLAATLRQNPGLSRAKVPIEMLTGSDSGLDPEISVDSAKLQVPRVAKAPGLSRAVLETAVRKHTMQRTLGIFGEPRVNVLELNLDVLKLKGGSK